MQPDEIAERRSLKHGTHTWKRDNDYASRTSCLVCGMRRKTARVHLYFVNGVWTNQRPECGS